MKLGLNLGYWGAGNDADNIALAQEADLYFMDEPFTGVDAATEHAIIELLTAMKESGATLLVVHHDLTTAPNYFDRLMLLNMHLVASGETADIFTPELLQKTYGGRLTVLSELAFQGRDKPRSRG